VADSLLRQWTILKMLPVFPDGKTEKSILDKLKEDPTIDMVPSARTIARDLKILEEVFYPSIRVEHSKGKENRWLIDAKESLDISVMKTPTALTFYMVKEQLSHQLPKTVLEHLRPHFNTAKRVLDMTPNAVTKWNKKMRVIPQAQQLKAPDIDGVVMDNIYTALLEDCRFDGKYLARGKKKPKSYRVNPLALVFRAGITYLICTINTHQDFRYLALHRFVDAVQVDELVDSMGFDLDEYLSKGYLDFKEGGAIQLELLIDADMAVHLEESRLSDDQVLEELDNGEYCFKATVQDTGQLRWWLFGFADRFEVIKPDSLRAEFKEKTARMAERYKI
jgi:predicted DNA-binding transcriptional regulator YafY